MARRADKMAKRFWEQMQAQIAQLTDENVIRAYGEEYVQQQMTPIMRADFDEILAHWRACEDAEHAASREGYPISLDPQKLWGDDVEAVAAEKIATQKRRAGYNALKRKVGEESAKRIISREAK